MIKLQFIKVAFFLTLFAAISCTKETVMVGKDPNTAEKVSIDRFSATAGKLMVRDASNGLPIANAAIHFDVAPFITKGLGPTGQMVEYYNFDVQSKSAIPIYVLFRDGETTPVTGQLNIIEAIPGDTGYTDFWLVQKVTVPKTYVANYVTSLAEIRKEGYTITATTTLVNCPVVPVGSTATKRIGGGSPALIQGWYKSKLVQYFSFEEKALVATGGMVATSPIYVTFKINPNLPNGGAASGFVTQSGTMQTHNVLATVPSSANYSPLWSVNVYDNAQFGAVSNLATAQSATILATGVATVNCPVVTQ